MLLVEGLDDWVPLAALSLAFVDRNPSPDQFFSESIIAIEPLLRQGLMTMGDLRGPDGFESWALTVDECLAQFRKIFYTEPVSLRGVWTFSIWLSLTVKGKIVAKEVYVFNPDPLGIRHKRDV
jgi:hypothetical protein